MHGPDTTAPLWDVYYWVKMPQLQLTSVDYLRAVGSYTTGDRATDRELAREWITTMAPIHRMVDHHAEGVQIRILNDADLKPIYQACTAHLNAWSYNLIHGINIGGAPIDDLLALDAFTQVVYTYAKYAFTPEVVSCMLAQHFSAKARFTPTTFFRKRVSQQVTDDGRGVTQINATPLYPERDAFAPQFLQFKTSSRWA